MDNYINYTNKGGLTYALHTLTEFTWMKDKYQEIFIDDIKYHKKVEDILGYVPNTFEELLDLANQKKRVASLIEDLFQYIHHTADLDVTLLSDISGKKLYQVDGTFLNSDSKLETEKDMEKVYLLNPDAYDYTDLFGHQISFHIYNE